MTEHRHYSGPDLAPLLRQLRDELGSEAEIVRAERIRSGGLAGFFAREHYEVVAKRPAIEPSTPSTPSMAVATAATAATAATLEAATPSSVEHVEPERTESEPNPAGTGRSIQAALLDRADRVSTEELLVRVAETHSAEWGSESFHSILGRAMVDAVGPSVDERGASVAETPSMEHRSDDRPQIDVGSDRRIGPIDGLRLEPIRPGENVIDPAPPAPADTAPDVPAAGSVEPDALDAGASQRPDIDDGLRALAQDRIPPQWANGVPPAWGPPWMSGWTPWMVNGWPGYASGEPIPGPAVPLVCANCAGPVTADDDSSLDSAGDRTDDHPDHTHDHNHDDGPSSAGSGDPDVTESDVEPSWSELRREIDDVRHLLDDIIGTLNRAATDDGSDRDREWLETGLDDDPPVEQVQERDRERTAVGTDPGHGPADRRRPMTARQNPESGRDRNARRTKNGRRSDRNGR